MKILVCGDVVGRSGREAIFDFIPKLKKQVGIDFIVANVDNAAHGFGITSEIAKKFFDIGIDVLTGGNHLFDQKEIIGYLGTQKRLLRPYNLPNSTPGFGIVELLKNDGTKIVVIHLLGQYEMPMIGNNPFEEMNKILQSYKLGRNVNVIIVDFHAELTSEKTALGHFLDSKVSIVVGTHTHIPTSDQRILEFGTAYQTDVGMCGDYNSVIGMNKYIAVDRFCKNYSSQRLSSSCGTATMCGLLVEVDTASGLATDVRPIRIGGELSQTHIL